MSEKLMQGWGSIPYTCRKCGLARSAEIARGRHPGVVFARELWTPLWLHGAELPPVEMYGYEPGDWVLAATPTQERETLATRLAEVIKSLIKPPDAAPPVSPWFAANVFSLACNLSPTRALADSMAMTLSRDIKSLHSVLRHPSVERHYRHALAITQVDDRLSDIWLTLLQGQSYGAIQPDPDRDVRGLCYLSTRDEKLVMQPAWDPISKGLKHYTYLIEKSESLQQRGTRMDDAISMAFDSWLRERKDNVWNRNLWTQFVKNDWPRWTLGSLTPFTPVSDVEATWIVRGELLPIFSPFLTIQEHDKIFLGKDKLARVTSKAKWIQDYLFTKISADALQYHKRYDDDSLAGIVSTRVNALWNNEPTQQKLGNLEKTKLRESQRITIKDYETRTPWTDVVTRCRIRVGLLNDNLDLIRGLMFPA